MNVARLRIVGATLDACELEIIGGARDGECLEVQLPPGVLLPPAPSIEEFVAEIERSTGK